MIQTCRDSIKETKKVVKKFSKRKPLLSKLQNKYADIGIEYRDERFLKWAYNLDICATYLEFCRFEREGLKLKSANFCKDRLCAMCNWRRSLRTFAKISKIVKSENFIKTEYKTLFLTLTVKNVEIQDLHNSIKNILYGFNKFTKNKRIKETVKGYFRALEITFNSKTKTYHPHLHVILAVGKSYFQKEYISQADLTEIWQSCIVADYKPIVDIRKFKGNKGIAEASKYCIKSDDKFLNSISNEALFMLRSELCNIRLLGIGGIFREIAKELKVLIDENIVDDDGLPTDDILTEILIYKWSIGLKNYELFKKESVGF